MRYLGVDFGLRRLGLAVSDGELASPLTTLNVRYFQDAVQQIMDLVKKKGFEKIIVGVPEGKMGQIVLGFVKALRKKGLEVIEADETLSSKNAVEQMIEQGIPLQKRKVNDSQAAAIILQNWLDGQ